MKIADIITEGMQYRDHEFPAEFLWALETYVRGKATYSPWPDEREEIAGKISRIFSEHMPELTQSYTLFRGQKLKSWQDMSEESNFQHNTTIRFDRHLSTSLSPQTARRFVTADANYYGHLFIFLTIYVKPGVRGIDTEQFKTAVDANRREKELILHRDTEYKVISAEKLDDYEWKERKIWLHNHKPEDMPPDEYWDVKLETVA